MDDLDTEILTKVQADGRLKERKAQTIEQTCNYISGLVGLYVRLCL